MGFAGRSRLEGSPDLDRAAAAAASCGVTRLADLTDLDRLGAPVFQAVRPWSRSLSVHNGKGLTPGPAQLGALMEAVESASAEAFEAPVIHVSFRELDPAERAAPADFAARRAAAPSEDEPVAWVAARRLAGPGVLRVPLDSVSLDFSRDGDLRLERSSNGLAAHFDRAAAELSALLELLERDALAAWLAQPFLRRAAGELDLASVPAPWFQELLARVRAAGVAVSVHRLPAVVGVAAFICQLIEPGDPRISARAYGTAADPSPEQALRGAVLEAVQSRLTFIAGSRDDVYFAGEADGVAFGFSLPLPPGRRTLSWRDVLAALPAPGPADAPGLAGALKAAGYPDAAVVDIPPAGGDARVIKAFCPGLGAGRRARRPPPGIPQVQKGG